MPGSLGRHIYRDFSGVILVMCPAPQARCKNNNKLQLPSMCGRPATCVLGGHEFVKDLSCLGADLARTVLVDNNPFSFAAQPQNGIPALPFLGDPQDR